jgi:pentatricopeptide repeat protein
MAELCATRQFTRLRREVSSHAFPTCTVYNTAISKLVEVGQMELASKLLQEMLQRRIKPNVVSFNIILASTDSKEQILSLRALMQECQLVPELITYNVMMTAFSKLQDVKGILALYDEILAAGLRPDVFTFAPLLLGLRYGTLSQVRSDRSRVSLFLTAMTLCGSGC